MNENLAHMQYLPGDPRLVDQLVYELKSKGIFDQFRKECIADVDTRPAYQNLRQRVETSVATFLSRQVWKPDLNKNQLREKLRKHLLDGNYLEQGVERIVDQVVNPKVASVFIPQVEDVVYSYLGIPRKKKVETEASDKTENDLLPTDLEAVSPGSVKSNDDKSEAMDTSESQECTNMEIADENSKLEIIEDSVTFNEIIEKDKTEGDSRMSIGSELICQDSNISIDKSDIPLPEEIKLENIPEPENSPPKINSKDIDLEKIELPKEPNPSTDIPLPDEMPKIEKETYYSKETIISTVISTDIPLPDDIPRIEKSDYFKPITLNSEDDDSSSNSSLRRNMSPLTPIRNYNNENSCDAQQAFESDSKGKHNDINEPSTFRFTIESKSSDNSCDGKPEKKEEQALSYQFNSQVNINSYNTPMYEESSNSNNLQIDYESDANSKATIATDIKAPELEQYSVDLKKEKSDDRKSSTHKSSHRSRDSHKHSSSKDKRSDSKQSSRDSSRHDKKPSSSSKDDKSKSSKGKDKPSNKSDKKESSRESSKYRSSSSHKSSSHNSHKESSSHRDSSSKHKSSSSRHSNSSKYDDKKSSSSHKDKVKERSSSDKSKDKDKSRVSKSSSHRSEKEKDRKSSSSSSKSKHEDKENKEKKGKKDTDDHYSLSGRGNHTRRSTDRDSNDGSSSSKGSHNPSSAKTADSKKDTKTSSKSGHTTSTDSTSPSDKEVVPGSNTKGKTASQTKPIVRVETHLENQILSPPRLPFVPDVTLKKPKFAANYEEAKRMMKMRKFLEDEQKRMNQEAALLLEFQANVRPSFSQVYSSIPGPELEFACGSNSAKPVQTQSVMLDSDNTTHNVEVHCEGVDENSAKVKEPEAKVEEPKDSIAEKLTAMDLEQSDLNNSQVNTEKSLENTGTVNVESKDTILATLTNDDEDKRDLTLTNTDLEQKQIDKIEPEPSDTQDTDQEKSTEYFEVTIITEVLSDSQSSNHEEEIEYSGEKPFLYFAEHEKYNAEIERDTFTKFYKAFQQKTASNKIYLINCDTYEENLIRDVSASFGQFEIINYHKNGHLMLPKTVKNIIKNLDIADEVTLPTKSNSFNSPTKYVSPIFSPVKSECSFELSSDYDAKLEEMVNKTSRQEIMEIILGGGVEESPCEMPTIDYCMESSIETENNLKRKIIEVESIENNNGNVLTTNKIRKLSESDQITSTTEESDETQGGRTVYKSKYLGKARRVGLSRPRKTQLPNSPSSDKSVENYDICTPGVAPNGKIKGVRSKVQRYDTSDLYKPKLHYLSRRNNVT